MHTRIAPEEKPLGVIEALQQGFDFLNHHLWLILLPILLDLFLWLGPRLSMATLIEQLVDTLFNQPDLPEALASNAKMVSENFNSLGADFNLLALLAGPFTGLPSLFARLDFIPRVAIPHTLINLTSWQSVLLWLSFLIPVGILVGSLWLTLVVFAYRNEPLAMRAFWGRWGWVWLNVNLYLIVLFIAIVLLSLFFGTLAALFMALMGSVGATLFSILWILFIGFSVWLSIGLFFVIPAVALDGVNLASATWRSLNVVGRNALSTMGFLLLIILITEGFSRIWLQMSTQLWGVLVGILGNAYMGTAIMAATLLFYQSRYQAWQKKRAMVISQRSEQNDNA
jgi:hypothetical protein